MERPSSTETVVRTLEERLDAFRGCLLGLACGDAVGTTVEFMSRGTFEPVTDMVGGGPFHLRPGEWTDDTSMALCLATSLTELGRFDARDQIFRYVRWFQEGYMSSNGRCFDIGLTIRKALDRFRRTGNPVSDNDDPYSAGNGSIMRLAPIPMFYSNDADRAIERAAESSLTTHPLPECQDACRLLASMLVVALRGGNKEEILLGHDLPSLTSPKIKALARIDYRDKDRSHIRGSGYVVDSLEAALWCFDKTSTFEEAILEAVNLGDDADTTAAVCGQLAGAYYGESGIPEHWLRKLVMREEIGALAERLMAFSVGV